jgi:hypothetical protein
MDFAHAYLFGLTVLALYALGVALMTTQVSYPLYTSVPTEAFVAYHHRYNRRIPLVVVVPAFVMFVACAALPFLRPDAVPGWIAACIAAGGLAGLLATVAAAIPSHLRLQRDGFDHGTYRKLRLADLTRSIGCTLSAGLLVWSLLLTFTPR